MCVSTVVPVTFKYMRDTVEICIALGLYNKQGCGDVAEKLSLTTKPTVIAKDYLESHPTRSNQWQPR